MNKLDAILNRLTMYRLVVYALCALTAIGIGAALLGHSSTSATAMVISLGLLLCSAYATDAVFGRLFNVPTNSQSWLITGLILFLIVHPATSVITAVALVLAGAVSSASKFLLARSGKHIFNPAALAAALLGATGLTATTWWIGSAMFWPFTLILGAAVVRKIRRVPLVLSFVTSSLVFQLIQISYNHQPLLANLEHALFSSPLIFLGTIMLTEPATMPPRRGHQMIFGGLVGLLYIGAWQIGPLVIYPEVALLIGNIYAYAVSPKFRLRLELKEIQRISDHVYNYVFSPDQPFRFRPGQYMEWTLAGVPYDSRGNRRSFTIASSPTERDVHLGIKYYEPASTYKATLAGLRPGATIYASHLAGDFTLGSNAREKLALIAGGIGITPFRSMVKYLIDSNERRDVVLLYAVADARELAYGDVFRQAARVGIKTIPIVTRGNETGPGMVASKMSSRLISSLIPDFAQRTFFISGPNVMVDSTVEYLDALGVDSARIKTDHFSGY